MVRVLLRSVWVGLSLLTTLSYGQSFRLTMRVDSYPISNHYYHESVIEQVRVEYKNSGDIIIQTENDTLKLILQKVVLSNHIYKIAYQKYWIQRVEHNNGLRIAVIPLEPFTDENLLVYILSFDRSVFTGSIEEADH